MKLSIWMKVFLFIAPVIVIMEGVVVRAYFNDHRQLLITSYERQFEVVAQQILVVLVEKSPTRFITADLLSSSQDDLLALCANLYERYGETRLTHIAVVDEKQRIIAHSDPAVVGNVVKESLKYLFNWRITKSGLEAGVYHVVVPILDANDVPLGGIDIGFSKQALDQDMQMWLQNASWRMFLLFVGIALVVSVGIYGIIVRPLNYLGAIGEQLLQGNLIHSMKLTDRRDEIAMLGGKFVRISQYLQEVTEIAEHVATGRLQHEIQKRSKRDTLSLAMQGMLTYLQSVAMFAEKIAGGDLTEAIPLRSDVDTFGRTIQAMRVGLQTLIQQIRDSAEELAQISSGIMSLSDQAIHIAADDQNAVEKLVSVITQMGMSAEEIAANMDVLSASVEETSASVTEMANSISSIAANAADLEIQTRNTIGTLQQTADTLEHVTGKAEDSRTLSEETKHDALEGRAAVEQVTASMDTIQQTNFSAVEAIARFAKQTADIDTILDVIDEITNQSDLLALNASIIAAQAGSHGRGFAVIAGEMRNLANKVDASTKDIAAIVQTVQKETEAVVQEIHRGTGVIDQGVKRTQHARQMLEKISESAQRSSAVVSDIVTALQEMQQTTGHDMKVAMERVHTMTTAITKATSEQKSSTLQMNAAVEHIRDMAVQTQEATNQQLEGVRQMLDVANEVRDLSDRTVQSSQHVEQSSNALNRQAQLLVQGVDRFKLLSHEAASEHSAERPSLDDAPSEEPVEQAEIAS